MPFTEYTRCSLLSTMPRWQHKKKMTLSKLKVIFFNMFPELPCLSNGGLGGCEAGDRYAER